MAIALGVLVLSGLVVLNVFATAMAVRDEFAEPRQKVLQVGMVWLVPLLGALLVLAVHRKPEKASGQYRREAEAECDISGGAPFVRRIAEVLDDD